MGCVLRLKVVPPLSLFRSHLAAKVCSADPLVPVVGRHEEGWCRVLPSLEWNQLGGTEEEALVGAAVG